MQVVKITLVKKKKLQLLTEKVATTVAAGAWSSGCYRWRGGGLNLQVM